jgi:hypothetical protein
MKRLIFTVFLIAMCGTASAGNSNGCQGNCPSDGGGDLTANGGNGYGGTGGIGYGGAGGDSSAVGVGVGIGLGGSATGGQGGAGGEGGRGGNGGAGGSGYGFGGAGGDGGNVVGSGNSANLNHNDANAVSGASSKAEQSLSNATDASSRNDNRSAATGNATTTVVSTKVERNAPPVYLGNIAATVSCAGGFNAGSSSTGGAGALGFTWISPDCKQVVAGDKMLSLGMADTACKIFKATDGFKRAARRDPSLRDVSCAVAK